MLFTNCSHQRNFKYRSSGSFTFHAMFASSRLKKYMAGKEIDLKIDLGQGNYSYEMQTCDFSHGYVDINAAYRT